MLVLGPKPDRDQNKIKDSNYMKSEKLGQLKMQQFNARSYHIKINIYQGFYTLYKSKYLNRNHDELLVTNLDQVVASFL